MWYFKYFCLVLGLILPSQDKTSFWLYYDSFSKFVLSEGGWIMLGIRNWCLMQLEIVFLLLCASSWPRSCHLHSSNTSVLTWSTRQSFLLTTWLITRFSFCKCRQWLSEAYYKPEHLLGWRQFISVYLKVRLNSQVPYELCLLVALNLFCHRE